MDLATTHTNADLDGIASIVALRRLEGPLELGLPAGMDEMSRRFWADHERELPKLIPAATLAKRITTEPLGRLCVGDTASPDRLGFIGDHVSRFERVRAWDNHPTVEGDIDREPMVKTGACTSALVVSMRERGLVPTSAEAGLFLLGIHADTGHFTFESTTDLDHVAAAHCLVWGADGSWPGRYAPKGYTTHQLELLRRFADGIRLIESEGLTIAVASIELSEFEPDLAVLLEQLRSAEGWPAAFLLAAGSGKVSAIGRSDGSVDVGEILRSLDGGGHASAGSAVLRQVGVADARALLEASIRERLAARRTAGSLALPRFHSVAPNAVVREAADLLHRHHINSLPIVERDRDAVRFVGLVSRQDVDAALRHGLADEPVIEISSAPPSWVASDRPLSEARRVLLSGGPRRLVVVGSPPDDVAGILTRGTLFRAWDADTAEARARRAPPRDAVVAMARDSLGKAWSWVERLGRLAESSDSPAHLVGGTVRDLILGRDARDVDVVIEGDAIELAQRACTKVGGRIDTHDPFGTATWFPEPSVSIDLASARSEFYERRAALPTVTHAGLRQDLYRRDFTINAMAVSLAPGNRGEVIDPYGGLSDLKAAQLRVLHGLSFHDDPTRVFRAARFAARLELELSAETRGLLASALRTGAFDSLSQSRVGNELHRTLEEREAVRALRLLGEWGVLTRIHPALARDRRLLGRLDEARSAADRLRGPAGEEPRQADVLWIVVGSTLSPDERTEARDLARGREGRSHLFAESPERVDNAMHALHRAESRLDAARVLRDLDTAELAVSLVSAPDESRASWIRWWADEGRDVRCEIDGEQLIAEGFRPGPAVGTALAAAYAAALDGATRQAQLEAARATQHNP